MAGAGGKHDRRDKQVEIQEDTKVTGKEETREAIIIFNPTVTSSHVRRSYSTLIATGKILIRNLTLSSSRGRRGELYNCRERKE